MYEWIRHNTTRMRQILQSNSKFNTERNRDMATPGWCPWDTRKFDYVGNHTICSKEKEAQSSQKILYNNYICLTLVIYGFMPLPLIYVPTCCIQFVQWLAVWANDM